MSTQIYLMFSNLSVFEVITEWPNKEAWNIFESFVTQNVSPYPWESQRTSTHIDDENQVIWGRAPISIFHGRSYRAKCGSCSHYGKWWQMKQPGIGGTRAQLLSQAWGRSSAPEAWGYAGGWEVPARDSQAHLWVLPGLWNPCWPTDYRRFPLR